MFKTKVIDLIFFGDQYSDINNISYAIHHALEQYRTNMVSMMQTYQTIIERTKIIDEYNQDLFYPIHQQIIHNAKQLPFYWEENEQVFLQLLKPYDLPIQFVLMPSNKDQSCEKLQDITPFFSLNQHQHPPRPPNNTSHNDYKREVASYNSINQVLIHLNRDWSSLGQDVRKTMYFDTILPKLQEYLPLESSDKPPLVLIPGAGLGRLAYEIAALGYNVEINECSGTMISIIHSLHDLLHQQKTLLLYPFLHFPFQDDWDSDLRMFPMSFPFIDDSPALSKLFQQNQFEENTPPSEDSNINIDITIESKLNTDIIQGINTEINADKTVKTKTNADSEANDARNSENKSQTKQRSPAITIQYGDFVQLYGLSSDRYQQYDSIITCFFIDTGLNILEYIQTIHRLLKPNGIWMNLGPLHYHSLQGIPYSYNHLQQIIQITGFEQLEHQRIETNYAGEDYFSMKPHVYIIPFTIFRKIQPIVQPMKHNKESMKPKDVSSPNYRLV